MAIAYRKSAELETECLKNLFHAAGWKSAEYPEQLLQAIQNSHSVVTAWDQDNLVGLINALSDGILTVYFHYMLVHPDYQQRGIGKSMMALMLQQYEGCKTKLLVSYDDAIDFYAKFGFKPEAGTTAMFITDMV